MIRINLIPLEDRPRSRRLLPLPGGMSLLVYGLGVLVLVAVLAGYLMQTRAASGMSSRLVELTQREQELNLQTRAIEEIERRSAVLQQRLALFQQLEDRRFLNIEWLNTVNDVIPSRLWLERISHNQDSAQSTIEGIATGYQPISELMRAMEESGRFVLVQLVKAERQNTESSSVIRFTVAAGWANAPARVEAP